MNAFMVFSQIQRRMIIAKNPDAHNAEISKVCEKLLMDKYHIRFFLIFYENADMNICTSTGVLIN
jgi:hypothetical protein